MKKIFCALIIFLSLILCAGCQTDSESEKSNKFSAAMMTDINGINDHSFNASAWKGLQEFSKESGCNVRYLETKQRSDFFGNLDRLADEGFNLIFGLGFTMADAIEMAAKINPEKNFAIVDFSHGNNSLDNITGAVFKAEEISFIVGYIAAQATKTNKVGFIGGMEGVVVNGFEKGYRAGVEYAALELGKTIDCNWQYAESFSDAAKVKGIAMKMYSSGTDIIFHASGQSGAGLIEAAKETDNFVIGVDEDQRHLAPKNVLTSAIKNVGKAAKLICYKALNGEKTGGQTFSYGVKEECVALPELNPNLDTKIYNAAMKIKEKIANGEIIPPFNDETYSNFKVKYDLK